MDLRDRILKNAARYEARGNPAAAATLRRLADEAETIRLL